MKRAKDRLSIGFLYDDTLDSADGVAQQVKTLGTWFGSQGHQVSYLVGETKAKTYGGRPVYSLARNIRVVFNGNRMSVPLAADRRAISQALSVTKLDVIHVQAPFSPLMAGLVIKRAPPSTAVVATFHIFPSSALAATGSKLLRLAIAGGLKRLDAVTSVSDPAAKLAQSAFGLGSEIIPNTIYADKFAKGNKARKSGSHIVFLGRLVKRKGCMQLLKAFEVLCAVNPKAMLTIAGDGPQRQSLEDYVASRRLSSRVMFTGFVDETDKPDLLSSADIACFPSLYGESFGIVLIEAMAAGAGVVIGGNNPGYTSVLGERKESLFNPSDTAELAGKLDEFLNDKKLADETHRWQASQVKQYDVAAVGPKLESVYRRAIAKRGKTRHN